MQDVRITTKRLLMQIADSDVVEYVDERSGQDTDLNGYLSKLPAEVLARILEDKSALLELLVRLIVEHGEDHIIVSAKTPSGEVIGYMSIANTKAQSPWFSISVVKNQQRKGYAHEMMCGFLEWLRENAPDKALLYCVRPDNTASIALVKKVGGQLVKPKSFVESVVLHTYIIPISPK